VKNSITVDQNKLVSDPEANSQSEAFNAFEKNLAA